MSRKPSRAVQIAAVSMVALTVTACSHSPGSAGRAPALPTDALATCHGTGVEIDSIADLHGQATPLAAAQWFSQHQRGVTTCPLPTTGWTVTATDTSGATVRSGAVMLHTMQGPDHTWLVDELRIE